MRVTEQGIYEMTNPEYHADAALSASGLKLLIEAPALYKYEREFPRRSQAFDLGTVWHSLVLGDVSSKYEIVRKQNRSKDWVEAGDYDTVSAKADMERIVDEGKTPILGRDLRVAEAMAKRFNTHPAVREYLDLANGSVEQSAFWKDPRTGVMLRARFDFLPNAVEGKPFTIVDPKTAQSSEPQAWLRKAVDYGYHIQAAMYVRAVKAMGIHPRPQFLFMVQEKRAPYIVSPIRIAPRSLAIGDLLIDRAIDAYLKAIKTGHWPGYVDDVFVDDLPKFYTDRFEDIA